MLRRVQDADRARDPASLWDRLGWSKAPGPARIEAAARTGTLFVADYHAMTGMAPGVTKDYLHFGWAPIALFIVEGASNEGDLAPVLIQCGQDPSRFPHFTPEDGIAWKMAMTAVNVADNSYQGMVLHFTRCHLIMEAITLACHRNLSAEHPLMILLQPHFEMTLRANVDMRAMVGPGGVLPTIQSLSHDACVRLARAEIATFRWDEQQLDAEIARRDVDADALEFYPWRDDLRSARGPIASFVEQYVHLYYSGDTEVAGDVELANLLRELGAHDGGRINGLPLVKSKRSLGSFLTGVIFRATAYHATINYSGYDNWGCVPLSPTSGYYPEPYEAKEAIEENLWRMFAPPEVASQLLGVGWILRETRVNQLGSYRPGHFLDTRAGQLVHRFQRDLHDVDEQLKEIDARREISYPWAQPSRVPASIHV
jgi:arachidonate 15-lipoxygenase